jgi:RpiR family transcriptional regulator, carbohydrate utilization regulator
MSFPGNIQTLYHSFSEKEKTIADYLINNRRKVQIQTVEDIAEGTSTSIASVSRLVRKLGYPSFKKFKIGLVKDERENIDIDFFYKQIKIDDSDSVIIDKIFACNIKSLYNTKEILDKKQLIEVANIINNASKLIFLGIGSSGQIAKEAAMRFSFLEYPAYAFTDPHDIYFHTAGTKTNDVVFGISHTGRTQIMVRAVRIAKENGATTVGISSSPESPIHKECKYFFCTVFPENNSNFAELSSLAAQLCIIDTLYIICAKATRNMFDYKKLNKIIENNLRL